MIIDKNSQVRTQREKPCLLKTGSAVYYQKMMKRKPLAVLCLTWQTHPKAGKSIWFKDLEPSFTENYSDIIQNSILQRDISIGWKKQSLKYMLNYKVRKNKNIFSGCCCPMSHMSLLMAMSIQPKVICYQIKWQKLYWTLRNCRLLKPKRFLTNLSRRNIIKVAV